MKKYKDFLTERKGGGAPSYKTYSPSKTSMDAGLNDFLDYTDEYIRNNYIKDDFEISRSTKMETGGNLYILYYHKKIKTKIFSKKNKDIEKLLNELILSGLQVAMDEKSEDTELTVYINGSDRKIQDCKFINDLIESNPSMYEKIPEKYRSEGLKKKWGHLGDEYSFFDQEK
jgi:hypothetical protein